VQFVRVFSYRAMLRACRSQGLWARAWQVQGWSGPAAWRGLSTSTEPPPEAPSSSSGSSEPTDVREDLASQLSRHFKEDAFGTAKVSAHAWQSQHATACSRSMHATLEIVAARQRLARTPCAPRKQHSAHGMHALRMHAWGRWCVCVCQPLRVCVCVCVCVY
jgi:hypothetical protein